jgi:hypothetical protein
VDAAPTGEQRWIGVDLDGTLAKWEKWGDHIGEPVIPMMWRVQRWLRLGERVKIFTARASLSDQIPLVKAWLAKYGLGHLEVTNVKDLYCKAIWDDIAIPVEHNTGEIRVL